jgi:hypothetical protein
MNRTFLGTFEREEDLLQAAAKARQEGWLVVDLYSPYPVHGAAQALGLSRSRLPRAAFVFGLLGLALAFAFQFWASAWDWPINVGNRPWNSLPAFVPVAFEMMVLFAGIGVVLTLLLVCRLYPGKGATPLSSGVTDDRFVLEVRETGAAAGADGLRRLMQECHAIGVEERGL